MKEIDVLAHEIALENAIASVDSISISVREGDAEWMDISGWREDLGRDRIALELRYLELRGALKRHPSRVDWVRIERPGDVW